MLAMNVWTAVVVVVSLLTFAFLFSEVVSNRSKRREADAARRHELDLLMQRQMLPPEVVEMRTVEAKAKAAAGPMNMCGRCGSTALIPRPDRISTR